MMSLPPAGLNDVQINALTDSQVRTFCTADEHFCDCRAL